MGRRRWQQGYFYRRGHYWYVRTYEDQIDPETGRLVRQKGRPVNLGRAEEPGKITEKQARKRCAEVMRGVNEDSHRPQSLLTIEEYVSTKFRPQHIAQCKPAGRKHYEHVLGKHVLPALGTLALRDLTVDHVRDLIAFKAGRLAPQTVRHIKAVLRALLRHAKESGHYSGENPAAVHIKLPDRLVRPIQGYTWEEAQGILEHLTTPLWEMAALSMATSVNVAEMCGIRIYRVNLRAQVKTIDGETCPPHSIAIHENWYEGQYGTVKAGKRRRRVPIPAILLDRLEALCRDRDEACALFANQAGVNPIDPHNVSNRAFRKLSARLGIKINWHRFRHTHATFTDQLGMETPDRMALGGWGRASTMAGYTHTQFDRLRAGSEAIIERLTAGSGRVM